MDSVIRERDLRIDFLRFIGIFLIMLAHVYFARLLYTPIVKLS